MLDRSVLAVLRLVLCVTVAAALTTTPLFADGEAPIDDEAAVDPGWTAERMLEVRRAADARISPDGTRVVYAVNTAIMDDATSVYRQQIWLAATDGSWTRPLTFDAAGSRAPRWSPDGRFVTFISGRGGPPQVWILPIEGGEPWALTRAQPAVGGFEWSPDGQRIALAVPDGPTDAEKAAQQGKDDAQVVGEGDKPVHLWVIDVPDLDDPTTWGESVEARRLTEGDYHAVPAIVAGVGWSPDSRSLVFVRTPTTSADDWPKSDLAVVDVDSAEVRALAVSDASEARPVWSPDGRWIAFQRSDEPPSWGFALDIAVVPAEGGEVRMLPPTADRGNTDLIGWSRDSTKVLVSEVQGTVTRVVWLPLDGSTPVDIEVGARVIDGIEIAPSGDRLSMVAQGLHQAPEVYVSPLDRFEPTQVSAMNGHLADLTLPKAEVLRWNAPDGREIEGLLIHPTEREGDARVPLLLNVHGGPSGVFTQRFLGDRNIYPLAAFAQAGIAVLRPNPRGSSGYGHEFRYANYEDWGGGDYRDLMAGVDRVIEMGLADPDRLGVAGWSYGGYMTSWMITQTDRFAAAAVGAGVTNLRSFVGTADIPSFLPDYFGGEYWDNPDIFRERSAISHVANVETPTLILHGNGDLRVPVSQGHELRVALERRDVPVEMVVYPRMPHGPREPKHLRDLGRRHLDWFGHYLLGWTEDEETDGEDEDGSDGEDEAND
ncbi:MAG: S9 family peptidase [Acidobacteriota bacterium]